MSLVRLIAENIGPFDRVDVDFSDGSGRPYPGPHILAGVNGSGKSTLLRAIAWAMSWPDYGFPEDESRHFLKGPKSRVVVQVTSPDGLSYIDAATADPEEGSLERLQDWVWSLQLFSPSPGLAVRVMEHSRVRFGNRGIPRKGFPFTIGAYAAARALSYVGAPSKMEALTRPTDHCLGFESSVQNQAIQRWLVDLFSRRALAKERGQEFETYEQTLNRFQDALKLVCGHENVGADVELATMEPRLCFHGNRLNFSQLSDGMRSTVGWLADFMMRQDQNATRPGLLLLDEVDIYLHPRWQRILLPAMRRALPDVQIIASSHSPFVISSCADARIHVLTLDEHGVAHAQPPQNAPFGESVTATLKDIFGVDSRFDAETERDLKTWDELKRAEATRDLTPDKKKQLEALSHELSERSEELRLIVNPSRRLPANLLDALESRTMRKAPRARAAKKSADRSRRKVKLA